MHYKTTIADFQKWPNLVRSDQFSPFQDGSPITFNESTEVVVYGVEFLKRLDQLLPKFDKR